MGIAVLLASSGTPSANAAEKTQATQPRIVTIAGMNYSPTTLKAHVGDTVEFQNKDIVPHTATSVDADGFNSGMIKPGETWSVVLKKSGEFHFACQFHTDMKGVIEVEK